MTTIHDVVVDTTGPIRLSAILDHILRRGHITLADTVVAMVEGTGRTCPDHGLLDDPIVMVDPELGLVAVICPWCPSSETRERWESQCPTRAAVY